MFSLFCYYMTILMIYFVVRGILLVLVMHYYYNTKKYHTDMIIYACTKIFYSFIPNFCHTVL